MIDKDIYKLMNKYFKDILEHSFNCRVCYMNLQSALLMTVQHLEEQREAANR